MAKSYVVFSKNISKDLEANVSSKSVTIPPKVELEVELSLEDPGYKKIVKDPLWLQKVANVTKAPIAKGITKIAKEIDKAAESGDNSKTVTQRVEALGQELATDVANTVKEALKAYIDDVNEYKIYKVKAAGKIAMGVVGLVGSVTTAVLTGGAGSPLAIIGFTRSGIAVAQNVAKLALDAEKVERLIRTDFSILFKLMNANKNDARLNGAKEVGLNLLASVVGIETTSIANCDGRIELYKNKITGLKKESHKLSAGIYKIMDMNEDLSKKLSKIKSNSPNIKKAEAALDNGEKTLNTVIEKVVAIGERVEKAEGYYAIYKDTIDAMKKGVPAWTSKVSTVASLVIDLGSGIADASSAIEKGMSALQSVMSTVADQVVENA